MCLKSDRVFVLRDLLGPKILFNRRMAPVSSPIGWSAVPENIFQIQSHAAFDEKPHHFVMPSARSLMQRCRVGMSSE